MKNLILTLISVVTLFSMSSCSKDSTNSNYPLDGTTWVSNEGGATKLVGTLKFSETTFSVEYTWIENGKKETNGETGTYTYVHPNITLKANELIEKAVLNGDKITFSSSSSSSSGVFQKQ